MLRRPRDPRRLLWRADPWLRRYADAGEIGRLERYLLTLDLGVLGESVDAPDGPTVWTLRPLMPRYDSVVAGSRDPSVLWGVFASHVVSVDRAGGLVLDWEQGPAGQMLRERMREDIPPDVYCDLAAQVIEMANADGVEIPFAPPAGLLATLRRYRLALPLIQS